LESAKPLVRRDQAGEWGISSETWGDCSSEKVAIRSALPRNLLKNSSDGGFSWGQWLQVQGLEYEKAVITQMCAWLQAGFYQAVPWNPMYAVPQTSGFQNVQKALWEYLGSMTGG